MRHSYLLLPLQGSPQISRHEAWMSQRSSLSVARAGWAADGMEKTLWVAVKIFLKLQRESSVVYMAISRKSAEKFPFFTVQWRDMQTPWQRTRGKLSWRCSAVCGGTKCSLQAAAVSHGGGKSQKRLPVGWPFGQSSASGAMGSLLAAGFQPEGGHLVCLTSNLQGEVIEGLPAEQCRGWRGDMSISPDKHHQRTGQDDWNS